jgi:hypothetical protein
MGSNPILAAIYQRKHQPARQPTCRGAGCTTFSAGQESTRRSRGRADTAWKTKTRSVNAEVGGILPPKHAMSATRVILLRGDGRPIDTALVQETLA